MALTDMEREVVDSFTVLQVFFTSHTRGEDSTIFTGGTATAWPSRTWR